MRSATARHFAEAASFNADAHAQAAGWQIASDTRSVISASVEHYALGESFIVRAHFLTEATLRVSPLSTMVQTLVALSGKASVEGEYSCLPVNGTRAAVMASSRPMNIHIDQGACLTCVGMHRDRLSMLAHDNYGALRGFVRDNLSLDIEPDSGRLLHAVRFVLDQLRANGRLQESARRAYEDVLAASFLSDVCANFGLSVWTGPRELLPKHVKSVVQYVLAHPEGEISLSGLAEIAGISDRTLRRSFIDFVGEPLSRFILNTRLDHVRALLESDTESRSLSELSRAIGFANYSGFAKAYVLRHNENPSETRSAMFSRKSGRLAGALRSRALPVATEKRD